MIRWGEHIVNVKTETISFYHFYQYFIIYKMPTHKKREVVLKYFIYINKYLKVQYPSSLIS